MRHGREERGVQPLRPDRKARGVATRAEVAALAREGQQILVRAVVAADAGDAVLEHLTGEELHSHLRDGLAPRAVLAREALVVNRLKPMQMSLHHRKSGDAWSRRGL